MGLWDTILSECVRANSATRSSAADARARATRRVVIVGPYFAGKRTLAARLRDAAAGSGGTDAAVAAALAAAASPGRDGASGDAAVGGGRSAQRRGAGIDHSFAKDAALACPVEIFCVDAPHLLPLALPSAALLPLTFVVYVVDLSVPAKVAATVARWRHAVNARVAALLAEPGGGAAAAATSVAALAASRQQQQQPQDQQSKSQPAAVPDVTPASLVVERQAEWEALSALLPKTRERVAAATAASPAAARQALADGNGVLLDDAAVSLLPGFVLGGRLDAFERLCRRGGAGSGAVGGSGGGAAAAAGTAAAGSRDNRGIVFQFLRRLAIDARCGVAAVSLAPAGTALAQAAAQAIVVGVWDAAMLALSDTGLADAAEAAAEAATAAAVAAAGGGSLDGSLAGAGGISRAATTDAALFATTTGGGASREGGPLAALDAATQPDADAGAFFIAAGCDAYGLLSGTVLTDAAGQRLADAFPPTAVQAPKPRTHHEFLAAARQEAASPGTGGDMWAEFES